MEFSQIALLLSVAAGFGIIAKFLRQPLLIGYLFAGFVLASFGLVHDMEVFSGLGQIGVTLLLFLVGIEMKLSELPEIGKPAVLTGLGQIIFTSGIGYLLSLVFGFGALPSLYIAVALTFSSTIIMIKLLSEKNDLGSLYGRISVGFLLIQDLVAVLILMFLASLKTGNLSLIGYLLLFTKGIGLFVAVWLLSKKVLPYLIEKYIATNQELLFIFSIAWALGIAALVGGPLGFSLEIGGFLAGLSLSNLPEHLEIASKTKSIRDFFLTIFFLILGTKLVIGSVGMIIIPALLFSLFVLVGNPLIVMVIMGLLGYRKRTSFLAGLTVAQISEFSLILMAMGASLGHVDQRTVAMVVLVGVITMTFSTYLILGADKVYKVVAPFLNIFERKSTRENALNKPREFSDHVILIGCDRTGEAILPIVKKRDIPVLVIDFNPLVYKKLTADKVPVIFGDITDPDTLPMLSLKKARLVVSTTTDLNDNLTFLEYYKNSGSRATVIMMAKTRHDAILMYEKGAHYVLLPQVIAGEHIRHVLKSVGVGGKVIEKMGKSHFNRLVS